MVACTGCFAHRPANELMPDAPITVEFIHPRMVAAVGEEGDSLWLRDVKTLRGRMQRITRDTVYLHVTRAATPTHVIRSIPPDRLVTITRQPGVLVEGREFKPLRTAGLIIGVTALLAAIGIVVLISTLNSDG
jgi:hypothetical protein